MKAATIIEWNEASRTGKLISADGDAYSFPGYACRDLVPAVGLKVFIHSELDAPKRALVLRTTRGDHVEAAIQETIDAVTEAKRADALAWERERKQDAAEEKVIAAFERKMPKVIGWKERLRLAKRSVPKGMPALLVALQERGWETKGAFEFAPMDPSLVAIAARREETICFLIWPSVDEEMIVLSESGRVVRWMGPVESVLETLK